MVVDHSSVIEWVLVLTTQRVQIGTVLIELIQSLKVFSNIKLLINVSFFG